MKYKTLAKALIQQGVRVGLARLGLAWLGGPVAFIAQILMSHLLSVLIEEDEVKPKFKRDNFKTLKEMNQQDRTEYIQAIRDFETKNDKEMTKQEKKKNLDAIKKATKKKVAIGDYVKK